MSIHHIKKVSIILIAVTVSCLTTVRVYAQQSQKRSGPSQYIKNMQQVNRAQFVADFLEKKRAIDDMVTKQKIYTRILTELDQKREGVDELIRQEKRQILMGQLKEMSQTVELLNE